MTDPNAIFTALTLGTFAVCALASIVSDDGADVFGLACLAVISAGVSRVVSAFIDPPWSMAFYPVTAAILLAFVWASNRHKREQWKSNLGFVYFGLLVVHAVFWATRTGETLQLRNYILANNLLYATTMLVLACEGVRCVLRFAVDRVDIQGRLARWRGLDRGHV